MCSTSGFEQRYAERPLKLNGLSLRQIRFIAELRRANRAREAPWVRKNGNSSSRENLVMTSAYERTPSVQTLGEEEGRLEVSFTGDLMKCHLFLSGFVRNLYSSCQSTIGDVDLNFEDRIFFLNENMKDNDRGQE